MAFLLAVWFSDLSMALMSIQAWKLLLLVLLLSWIGTDERLMRSQKSFGRLRSSCAVCSLPSSSSSTGGTLEYAGVCSNSEEVEISFYTAISTAFRGNTYLKKVSADAYCVRIETNAFQGCTNLREVSFPGLKSVGSNAFENSGLETFTYGGNDPILFDSSVFTGCASLKSVVLSAADSTVQESMFEGCVMLTELSWSATVSYIGNRAFYGCSLLNPILKYADKVSLGSEAFANSGVKMFDVRNKDGDGTVSLETGQSSFEGCQNLRSFATDTIGNSIPGSMFKGCSRLETLIWPGEVSGVGKSAFQGCSRLAPNLQLSPYLTLSDSAFSGCGLVTFTTSTTNLGTNVFENCVNLKQFTYTGTSDEIPSYLVAGCVQLTEFTWEPEVTSVGESAFQGCPQLDPKLTLSESMLTLEQSSYFGSGVVSFSTSTSTRSWGTNVFENCVNLKQFTYTGTDTQIPNSLVARCVRLVEFTWEPEVTNVGERAFYNCSQLVPSVKFSSTVVFGDYSMSGCGYETFDIDNVGSFGKHVFENCVKLRQFTYRGSSESIPSFLVARCVPAN